MAWIASMPDEPGAYAICYAQDDWKSFMRRETRKGAVVEEVTEEQAIRSMQERMAWNGKRSNS